MKKLVNKRLKDCKTDEEVVLILALREQQRKELVDAVESFKAEVFAGLEPIVKWIITILPKRKEK